jgi:uncharacterized membrane protein YwzB
MRTTSSTCGQFEDLDRINKYTDNKPDITKMTENKNFLFLVTFFVVIWIYIASIPFGEFIVKQDARTGQVLFFVTVLFGMTLFYLADSLAKKYSGN